MAVFLILDHVNKVFHLLIQSNIIELKNPQLIDELLQSEKVYANINLHCCHAKFRPEGGLLFVANGSSTCGKIRTDGFECDCMDAFHLIRS